MNKVCCRMLCLVALGALAVVSACAARSDSYAVLAQKCETERAAAKKDPSNSNLQQDAYQACAMAAYSDPNLSEHLQIPSHGQLEKEKIKAFEQGLSLSRQ